MAEPATRSTWIDPTHLARVLEAAVRCEEHLQREITSDYLCVSRQEAYDAAWEHVATWVTYEEEQDHIRLCTPTFIRSLIERCQELEKDRERLDWLLENGASVGSFTEGLDWVVFNEDGDIMHCNWQSTPRAAIDDAREREGENRNGDR